VAFSISMLSEQFVVVDDLTRFPAGPFMLRNGIRNTGLSEDTTDIP
jgi:hypothetical protein